MLRVAEFAERLFFQRMNRFTPEEIGEIWGSLEGLMAACHRDAATFFRIGHEISNEGVDSTG